MEGRNRYIGVTGGGRADVVDAYLYSYAGRAITVQNPEFFAAVIIITGEFNDLDYHANYQAERLRSGMYGAVVATSLEELFADDAFAYGIKRAGANVEALKGVLSS